jgi:hypothetical protein
MRVTDEEIKQAIDGGKFIRQICRSMGVGVHRVRRVAREQQGGER